MNPETKLTIEQLNAICVRHSIPYISHARITSGFTHEVHRLNEDLIIKAYNKYDDDTLHRFETESALLASNLDFPKPKLIALSDKDNPIDRNYIIMSYVPGISLGSVWHKANDSQRENLVKDISRALKLINQVDPTSLGLKAEGTWDQIVLKRGEKLVAKLRSKNTIDDTIAQNVLQTFQNNTPLLSESKLYPVFYDIHLDNFIVNDEFELQAVIDLENIELASLDYPLFVIQKMTDEPEKYLAEEDEKYADKKDYEKLKGWYRKYYPEMFNFESLDIRVKLYQKLDTLRLLTGWPQSKELYTKLDQLTF